MDLHGVKVDIPMYHKYNWTVAGGVRRVVIMWGITLVIWGSRQAGSDTTVCYNQTSVVQALASQLPSLTGLRLN